MLTMDEGLFGDEHAIAEAVSHCLGLFSKAESVFVESKQQPSAQGDVSIIQNEVQRFRIWAGNVAAHQRGRSSLDFRLRDASHLHRQVMNLLRDLSGALQDGMFPSRLEKAVRIWSLKGLKAIKIATGEKIPWDQLSNIATESSDASQSDKTEMRQIIETLKDSLSCLFRLSMTFRAPAPHDHILNSGDIDVSGYEQNDLQYIRDKFPFAEDEISERLANAITRRRQYLKYRELRHSKLRKGIDSAGESLVKSDYGSTIATSLPDTLRNDHSHDDYNGTTAEPGSVGTSFMSTLDEATLSRFPPMPGAAADDQPFECPLCYMIISLSPGKERAEWRQHVYKDLSPYVCLHISCNVPARLYGSQHEWFNHELRQHRSDWRCPRDCDKSFKTLDHLKYHMIQAHKESAEGPSLDSLQIACRKGPDNSVPTPTACPLCGETLPTLSTYRGHVGKHQQQLALFALPLSVYADEADDGEELLDSQEHENCGSATPSSISSSLQQIFVSSGGACNSHEGEFDSEYPSHPMQEARDAERSPVESHGSALVKWKNTRVDADAASKPITTSEMDHATDLSWQRPLFSVQNMNWQALRPLQATVEDAKASRDSHFPDITSGNPPGIFESDSDKACNTSESLKRRHGEVVDWINHAVEAEDNKPRREEFVLTSSALNLPVRGSPSMAQGRHPSPRPSDPAQAIHGETEGAALKQDAPGITITKAETKPTQLMGSENKAERANSISVCSSEEFTSKQSKSQRIFQNMIRALSGKTGYKSKKKSPESSIHSSDTDSLESRPRQPRHIIPPSENTVWRFDDETDNIVLCVYDRYEHALNGLDPNVVNHPVIQPFVHLNLLDPDTLKKFNIGYRYDEADNQYIQILGTYYTRDMLILISHSVRSRLRQISSDSPFWTSWRMPMSSKHRRKLLDKLLREQWEARLLTEGDQRYERMKEQYYSRIAANDGSHGIRHDTNTKVAIVPPAMPLRVDEAKKKEEVDRLYSKQREREEERAYRHFLCKQQEQAGAEEKKYQDFLRRQKGKEEKETTKREEEVDAIMKERLERIGYSAKEIEAMLDPDKAEKKRKQRHRRSTIEGTENSNGVVRVPPPLHPGTEDKREHAEHLYELHEVYEGMNTPTLPPGVKTLDAIALPKTPVYPKINRQYIDLETLDHFKLPWEFDRFDPNYIVVLRELKQHETDVLFEHTAARRRSVMKPLALPEIPREPRYAWIRRREGERSRDRGRDLKISEILDASREIDMIRGPLS